MMDVIDAIHSRQSAGKMKDTPVTRALIERLLEAGAQAPNHYKVTPWRFVVLTGDGRRQLGDVMAQVFQRKFPTLDEAALDKERAKPFRAPLIIAVAAEPPTESKVLEVENICAAAAACENILLAAEGLGLAAHWRTGDAARESEIKRFLGFEPEQHLVAFLYIGYAEAAAQPRTRPGFEDRTRWIT